MNDRELITQITNEYYQSVLKNDFAAMTSHLYPELFKKNGIEQVIADIKDGMDNDNHKIIINNIFTDSISDVYKEGMNKYAIVRSRVDAYFLVKGNGDSTRRLFNSMCSEFAATYGNETKCDSANNQIAIIMPSKTFFIYDIKYKKWHMLGDAISDDVNAFVPEKVKQAAGN